VAVLRGVFVKKNIMRSLTAEEVEQKEKGRRGYPNFKKRVACLFGFLGYCRGLFI
jgi:hypothetical protein